MCAERASGVDFPPSLGHPCEEKKTLAWLWKISYHGEGFFSHENKLGVTFWRMWLVLEWFKGAYYRVKDILSIWSIFRSSFRRREGDERTRTSSIKV